MSRARQDAREYDAQVCTREHSTSAADFPGFDPLSLPEDPFRGSV